MSNNEMIMLPREVVEQALEAWARGCPPDCKDGMTDSGGVQPWGGVALIECPSCKAVEALRAALEQPDARPTATTPAGWKLVPVGPTVEMMDAGGAATRRCYQHLNKDEVMCSYVYRHMLAASPQPPALGRPQSNPTTPYLWYDPENGDTWTQEAIDEGFFPTDNLIPLYAK